MSRELSIMNDPIEDGIIKAIEKTKEELKDLTIEPTCFVYSSSISENLYKEHISNRIDSTTEYDYPNIHQFNIVRKNDDEIYLIDLAYQHFQATKFYELLQKGYMLIREDQLNDYLEVVGNVNQNKRKR